MSISIIILLAVLLGIALRKLSPLHIPIWVMMTLGALAALATDQISIPNAFHAINYDIIGYLFGVFVIGQALEESGYLSQLSYHLFQYAKKPKQLLLLIIFMGGLASAFLMNDTIAIMATPIMLHIARQNKMEHKPLLLALAYAITIGSVMSPIGNPQNLLIAVNAHLQQPFITFLEHLFVPTILCLFLAYGVVWLRYRKTYDGIKIEISAERPHNPQLTLITKISLALMAILIVLKIASAFWKALPDLPFSLIAILSALPILLFSRQRFDVLRKMDWATIVFFMSMFVLMQSVWDSGTFQALIKGSNINISSTPSILSISAILSQLISNVPLVALYLPVLQTHGVNTTELMALAAGSTIAGNLLIMGAASNVIIIQNAEKRRRHAFSFIEFALTGIPLGILNLLVYGLFL